MNIDNFGQVEITEHEAIQALVSGRITDLSQIYIDNPATIERFNAAVYANADPLPLLQTRPNVTISQEDFDLKNQNTWFMPQEYQDFDILDWLYSQCTTLEQQTRVSQELELFVQHHMFPLLKYLKYLVDTMRANNIVWGVGRGSSVASYVLYLIGVHKIDSIKYDLDIREVLKGEQNEI